MINSSTLKEEERIIFRRRTSLFCTLGFYSLQRYRGRGFAIMDQFTVREWIVYVPLQ